MDHRPLNPARSKGVLVSTLVAILVASLLPTAAFASHNAGGDDPCEGAPAADDFADYDEARETHRPSIDCALYRGITSGAGVNADGAPLYRPDRAVNRAQMAQFIVNTIVAAGYDSALPNGQGQDEFNDISDSFARVAINRLARANIVRGTSANRYSPAATVSRQQMASFIVQAARFVVGDEHPIQRDSVDRFRDVDDDNPHKANIEAGADAGLFQGTSATTFSPGVSVIRDQMATFLVNLVEYSFNPDQAPAPYVAEVSVAETTVAAGKPVSGDIVGDHIKSATVSGCGLNDAALTDGDNAAEGIQFEVTVPDDQDAGECTLTFSVTFDNNSIRRFTQNITVTAENRATVTLASDKVNPGQSVTGEITGSNIKSATVSGCGLNNEPVQDRDTAKAGIQFSEVIPASQPVGACTLTFKITFTDDKTQDVPKQITVEEKVGVTTRPELIGADVVSTAATGTNPGTVVRFVFDENVTGGVPVGGRFRVYSFDATAHSGTSPRVDPDNSRAVLVRFADVTTDAQVADLTVAAVQQDAVTDGEQGNPQGNVPIGNQREDTIRQPGDTAAPDLESVGPFRPTNDQSTTAVDFTFDETTYTVNPGGFHLVLNNATVVNCQGPATDSNTAGGGNQAGGNGSSRITVVCTNPTSGNTTTQLSATNVARGYVDANAVSDAQQDVDAVGDTPEGNANPLQAGPVGATAAATASPDLVSATFAPGAGSAADQVTYTFDEAVVLTASNAVTGAPTNLFRVYNTAGDEVTATGATRGSNDRTVIATFPNGTLADAVGASARSGAVQGLSSGETNRADEVGVTNSTTRTITPGRTAGPDLLTVAINQDSDSATYTFDEAVNSSPTGGQAVQPSEFYLWAATGERLQCVGVPGTSSFTIDGAKVTCAAYRTANSPASATAVEAAVLGTVGAGAVDDAESGETKNPEGAAPTTGGTGKPQN